MADTEYVLNSKITVKTKNDVTFAKNNIRASAIKSYVDLDKIRIGDNIYFVTYRNSPYSVMAMPRGYIVSAIQAGVKFAGLKLSADGRLIEDIKTANEQERAERRQLDAIKKIMMDQIQKTGVFAHSYYTDTGDGIVEAVKQYIGVDSYYDDVDAAIEEISDKFAEENHFLCGWYALDSTRSMGQYCVGNPQNFIEQLSSSLMNDIYDFVLPVVDESSCLNTKGIPIWIYCGNAGKTSIIDNTLVILSIYNNVCNSQDRLLDNLDLNISDTALKVLLHIYERNFSEISGINKIDIVMQNLLSDIKCLSERGYSAKNPQETFKNTVRLIKAKKQNFVEIQDPAQYIDMVLALQEIMYKGSSNVQWGGISNPYKIENNRLTGYHTPVFKIPKAGIKIEFYADEIVVENIG